MTAFDPAPTKRLRHIYLDAWDAKYDYSAIEKRLICCLAGRVSEKFYWIDDSITELFCGVADILLPREVEEGMDDLLS